MNTGVVRTPKTFKEKLIWYLLGKETTILFIGEEIDNIISVEIELKKGWTGIKKTESPL